MLRPVMLRQVMLRGFASCVASFRLYACWLVFLAVLPAPAAERLDAFEAQLQADPGNLRVANDYRQAVVAAEAYDRCLAFFEGLTQAHPDNADVFLSYGFAHVDKIPAAGAITRVLLANTALQQFSKAVELDPSWLALYTRGSTYLYWPKIFERAALGVADLERAYDKQREEAAPRPEHVRVFISLGDGYWKTDQLDRARAFWREGLETFAHDQQLEKRLALEGEELAAYLNAQLDPNERVDTDLSLLWASE